MQSGIWNTNCEEKNWFRMIRGKGHKVYCYNTFYNKKKLKQYKLYNTNFKIVSDFGYKNRF